MNESTGKTFQVVFVLWNYNGCNPVQEVKWDHRAAQQGRWRRSRGNLGSWCIKPHHVDSQALCLQDQLPSCRCRYSGFRVSMEMGSLPLSLVLASLRSMLVSLMPNWPPASPAEVSVASSSSPGSGGQQLSPFLYFVQVLSVSFRFPPKFKETPVPLTFS